MSTRQELADAVSTVDGIRGYEFRPTVLTAGVAWALRGELERGEALDFMASWRIVVVLPPGEQRASEFFDAKYKPLAEALEDLGYVERIEPTLIATDAGDLDGMLITLRREA